MSVAGWEKVHDSGDPRAELREAFTRFEDELDEAATRLWNRRKSSNREHALALALYMDEAMAAYERLEAAVRAVLAED